MEIADLRVPGRDGAIAVRSYGTSDHVLVWAHGGGFVHGDLDMPEADWVARTIAEAGIRVLSVGYRLIGSGVGFPAPSDDVTDTLTWAIRQAPHTLFAGGASAGANLVTGAAIRLGAHASAIRRLLLAYPTLHAHQLEPDDALRALLADTRDPEAFSSANVLAMYETYVGGTTEQAPAFAIPGNASPAVLSSLPPVTIIAAEADQLRLSAIAFAEQLREDGVAVDLRTVPGAPHGFLNTPDTPHAADTIAAMVAQMDAEMVRNDQSQPDSERAT